MKDWTDFQSNTYGNNVCKLLVFFLKNYAINNAIDLGCGSGNEAVYMIKHGIKVMAIDRQLNERYILDRLSEKQKELITFSEQGFENIELKNTDAVMAFFSIPFCTPERFNELWDKIYDAITPGGYFVGQLFGDRDAWKDNKEINTISIDRAKELLQKYEIIKFDEVEYVRPSDRKKWHYYNIIAKK